MGSSPPNLDPNTQSRLIGAMSKINLNKVPYDLGDRYKLVDNSHTLHYTLIP